MEERVFEAERVGVMEGAKDAPDRLMSAFFGKYFIKEDETVAGNARGCSGGRRGARDKGFNFREVFGREGAEKAFLLEVLDFFVVEEAVLIEVAQDYINIYILSISAPVYNER